MPDYTELLQTMKRAAVEAVAAGQPLALCYGTVRSVQPLQIMADQKLPLEAEQLELTNAVQDCYIDVEISAYTENDAFMNGRHTHGITDTYTGGGDQRESRQSGHYPQARHQGAQEAAAVQRFAGGGKGAAVALAGRPEIFGFG